MSLDDFSPADDPVDPLDEDLFDFPPMEVSKVSSAASSQPEAESPSQDELDITLEEQAAPLPTGDPLDDVSAVDMSLDEEDEDLFGFPPAQGMPTQPEFEVSLDEDVLSPPTDSLELADEFDEENIDDLIREAKSETPPSSAEPDVVTPPAPAPVADDLESVAPATPAVQQVPVQQIVAQPAVVGLGSAPKALWVLTAASVSFMVGLLVIAWSFASTFEKQLEASRSQTAQVAPVEVQQPSQPTESDLGYDTAPRVEEPVQRGPEVRRPNPNSPTGFEAPHDNLLIVAESAIADGRFVEARRLLYGMLAEIDRLPAESRERAEEQASFLIASSHKSEAELLLDSPE